MNEQELQTQYCNGDGSDFSGGPTHYPYLEPGSAGYPDLSDNSAAQILAFVPEPLYSGQDYAAMKLHSEVEGWYGI